MNALPAHVTPLYASQAKATGGRDGHITTDDGQLTLMLTQPRPLGGRA